MNDIHTHAGIEGQQVTRFTPGQPSQAPADIPRVTIGNIQGVARYTHGQDDSAAGSGIPAPRHSSENRVHTGHLSYIHGMQQGPEATVTRNTAADLAPASGGILATLRNNAGFPTARVGPNATVELPGMGRTSVKVAANLGFLTLTADGRYVEAQGGAQGNAEGGLQAQGSQAQTAENGTGEQDNNNGNADTPDGLFPELVERAYAEHIADIPQGTYDSMLASATVMLGEGQDMESIVNALARKSAASMSMEPSQAAEHIQAGYETFLSQANAHIKAAGITAPSDLFEWARENSPEALRQALQGQLFGRSMKGYTDLMNSYFDNVPPTLEALQKGGVPTKEQGGKTFVQLRGAWMSLDAAVKARLV